MSNDKYAIDLDTYYKVRTFLATTLVAMSHDQPVRSWSYDEVSEMLYSMSSDIKFIPAEVGDE
jgi:hypothetical protein